MTTCPQCLCKNAREPLGHSELHFSIVHVSIQHLGGHLHVCSLNDYLRYLQVAAQLPGLPLATLYALPGHQVFLQSSIGRAYSCHVGVDSRHLAAGTVLLRLLIRCSAYLYQRYRNDTSSLACFL